LLILQLVETEIDIVEMAGLWSIGLEAVFLWIQ